MFVRCDRCGFLVEGLEGKCEHDGTMHAYTGGFYRVPWHGLGREGERVICDCCMHNDPAYKAIYGLD